MKNYSLNPTEENLIELLQTDPIGRKKSVLRFIKLLNTIEESCTIAVNGDWGTGKTFFVRQVKLILDALNGTSPMSQDMRGKIKGICGQTADPACHSSVYYDAWMYDHHEDPILSLVYAAIASGQSEFSPDRKRSVLSGAAALAGALSGRDITTAIKEAQGEDTLSPFKDADDVHLMVKEFINSLIEEKGNRLVFFIDELDRCKPDYAIRFMERIKHYFDDERITFVFSVSLSQLQATVKNYYGSEFDATRYLDKFFDLRMNLPAPDIEKFMQRRLDFYEETLTDFVCLETVKYFRLSLRETERYVRLAKMSVCSATKNIGYGFPRQNAILFAITYILPVMLGLQMTDINTYNDFVCGKNPQPWIDILTGSNSASLDKLIINSNENYDSQTKVIVQANNPQKITLSDRLREVYEAFFIKSDRDHTAEYRIGEMNITWWATNSIMETMSLLSDVCSYDI